MRDAWREWREVPKFRVVEVLGRNLGDRRELRQRRARLLNNRRDRMNRDWWWQWLSYHRWLVYRGLVYWWLVYRGLVYWWLVYRGQRLDWWARLLRRKWLYNWWFWFWFVDGNWWWEWLNYWWFWLWFVDRNWWWERLNYWWFWLRFVDGNWRWKWLNYHRWFWLRFVDWNWWLWLRLVDGNWWRKWLNYNWWFWFRLVDGNWWWYGLVERRQWGPVVAEGRQARFWEVFEPWMRRERGVLQIWPEKLG